MKMVSSSTKSFPPPMSPPQPYSEYNVLVNAPGYNERFISGVQIFSGENGIQNIELTPSDGSDTNPTVLDAHTLWEQYPPKIAEDMIKPVNPSGGIVLSRVVVPETIVVHDGAPADSTARDYYVPYKDYIKNVACNEIYSTWPDAAIRANVLAIQSFTLNRVYTEWYRGKGYDFTITSNTAFDQKWVYNATIFENVSQIVDEMFANYLSKPNVTQPLFTQLRRQTCILSWLDDTVGVKIPGRRRSYRHPDSQILLRGYNIHQHLGDYIRYTFFLSGLRADHRFKRRQGLPAPETARQDLTQLSCHRYRNRRWFIWSEHRRCREKVPTDIQSSGYRCH